MRESTDDRACLGRVNIAEEAGELLDVAIATMEFEGCTASIFDQVKDLVTLLLADYLPKNSTQVANILPEQVLLLRGSGRRGLLIACSVSVSVTMYLFVH